MTDYVRLTDVLRSFWDGLDKVNGVPREADVDTELLNSVWDDCYLVHLEKGEPYKYDYMGASLMEAYGDASMQSEVESLVYPSVNRVAEKFNLAIEGRVPMPDNGEFINDSNMLVKFRQLILPFGNDTGKVTHLLGGMRWRAF